MSVEAAFAERLRIAEDAGAIATVLDDVCSELGLPYHALVHHCDLSHPPDRFLFLQNYPAAWVNTYARLGLHRFDPVQQAAAQQPASFVWEDLANLVGLGSRERDVLAASRDAGLGDGFTVPLHAYGVRVASCSFAVRAGGRLPRAALLEAELLAHVAFSRLFALLYPRLRGQGTVLPPRERECVALLAQGKTDWEIGTILGLSPTTVREYLQTARRRFGVSRRTQLVAAALAHGLLGWDEIITWQSRAL